MSRNRYHAYGIGLRVFLSDYRYDMPNGIYSYLSPEKKSGD